MKRVCVLTGSSGLLGQYFCHLYRSEYEIVAVYRNNRPWYPAQDARVVDPTNPATEQAENEHPIYALRADLFDRQAPRRIVEQTLARYDRVDLIVNAAAATVWAPMVGSTRLADSAAAQFYLAVEAPLRLAEAAAELCWQADTAANRTANRNIVNVSSIAALKVFPGLGQSVYAAVKAAMNTVTAHMAGEFAPMGVRVNATAANSFPAIVPVQRAAAAIRALDQGTETGTVVVVDGDKDGQISLT